MNQVEDVYSGLGQLSFEYQAVTGSVNLSTTPFVGYTYSDPSLGSRQTSMMYPNGRTIDFNYSGPNVNGPLDNAIGRLNSISDGVNTPDAGQTLEQYSYLGLSTIVAQNHPETGINLTLIGAIGSVGPGGDQYVGLDNFGRVVDLNWLNAATGTSTDNFGYAYDQNSNVTAKNNLLNSAYSEAYSYDNLNRLTNTMRNGVPYENWVLDALGNWTANTNNGVAQARTFNNQNQITGITGTSATPLYDANGNMTTDQSGNTLVYDAWNRLVSVKNPQGTLIANYSYNAMGYRIVEDYPAGPDGNSTPVTKYLYYNSGWQLLETRTNGTSASNVSSQMVWSDAYINAAILKDVYSSGTMQASARMYFQYDANFDTTAVVGLVNGIWQATQRYIYSPYGTITILNANWTAAPAGAVPLAANLYQGMQLDPATGLYYERYRDYSPTLGNWIQQDPAGYVDGGNESQFLTGSPIAALDPIGLKKVLDKGDLKQLTMATLYSLFDRGMGHAESNVGGQQNLKTRAEVFAGYKLKNKELLSWGNSLGDWLMKSPYEIAKFLYGEQLAQQILKKVGKKVGKALLHRIEQEARKLQTIRMKSGGHPCYANMTLTYNPTTGAVRAVITGVVGKTLTLSDNLRSAHVKSDCPKKFELHLKGVARFDNGTKSWYTSGLSVVLK